MQRHQKIQGLPSKSPKGKRKPEPQGESSKGPQPKKQRDNDGQSVREAIILSEVEKIMGSVLRKLARQDKTKLSAFLRTKINDLKTDKRELVGVFGRSGAGKSSLINAIIGEKGLLPTGEISACTSVMIKVEENPNNSQYEADIEFITKKEWEDEVWSAMKFRENNTHQEQEDDNNDDDDDDDEDDEDEDEDDEDDEDEDVKDDDDEKMSAVYGDGWKDKTPENLMDTKYFKNIPEFLENKKKTLTCDLAEELSAEIVKYTRSDSSDGEGNEVTRSYWPLVKCVTLKVPKKDLLQHVTLVDLPGSGDRNKSRDEMWKGIVGNCCTVWIVTEITRAASEKEAWKILKNTCSLIGNSGECQQIHFICTKSDLITSSSTHSAADVRGRILQRNETVKKKVKQEFSKKKKIKKHFQDDCVRVFTVSSEEFLNRKHLTPKDTEIKELQDFLRKVNNRHSVTKNYVSGAHGILSLMQAANSTKGASRNTEVCTALENNMRRELSKIRQATEEASKVFKRCLKEGVKKSRTSYETILRSILYPRGVSGSSFHKTLKCVVENKGIYKPKKKNEINFNMKLASCLTNSIDEEFRKTFPNEAKRGLINGVINKFSLDTDGLIKEYRDVQLQLIFLKTEEEKIRLKLNKKILSRKKKIYRSLTETIQANMWKCYRQAKDCIGKGSLKKMRETIERHVRDRTDMFEKAKDEMLEQMTDLEKEIQETLQETLEKSIELSLKTDDNSIPDVAAELKKVKEYYKELNRMS